MVAQLNGPARALSVRQAAELLGISTRKLWRLLAMNELPSFVIGARGRRILETELAAYQQRLIAQAGR